MAVKAATQTTSWVKGEVRQVPGKEWKVKCHGDHYSCTCPAWRFQSAPPNNRTCKHIRLLLQTPAVPRPVTVPTPAPEKPANTNNSEEQTRFRLLEVD